MTAQLVLVTGATGYIGGRLVPRLLEAGHRVRCLVRSRAKAAARPWSDDSRVELVEGSLEDFAAVRAALEGCRAAYYLVHSMTATGARYREQDRKLAALFGRAAADAGVERIVYLGGLGETGAGLSEHLASRREVEHELARGGVPVTVFRAAMIIGSGSASFEILRYLVERLPVMITPRWVRTECQPVAIANVLHALVRCLEVPETAGKTLDLGGADVMTYQDILQVMAEELHLRKRFIIPVPVLTPRLSSLWIHLVTPLDASIARPLAEGLRNRVVARDDEAQRWIPQRMLGVREAIHRAVGSTQDRVVPTSWADAGPMPGDPNWSGGTAFEDRRVTRVDASVEEVFRAFCRVGGDRGWGPGMWLWRLRGRLDRLFGGPGLRRGRRDPEHLRVGDAVDFWRVTHLERPRRLSLQAEMKLPGTALLQFEVEAHPDGGARLIQTARFLPKGLRGILYWYAVLPLHAWVFPGLLQSIAEDARARQPEVSVPHVTLEP